MTLVVAALAGGVMGLGVWLALRGTVLLGRRHHFSKPASGQAEKASEAVARQASPRVKTPAANAQSVRKLVVAAGLAGLIFFTTHWIVLTVLVGSSVVLFWGRLNPNKQIATLAERGDSIASWIEMLYGTIAAGGGFEKAIVASARSAPVAIRPEVERLAARIEVVPLPQALRDFAHDMAHPACDKVATAITLASAKGAQNIVSLLRSQAASVRQESQLLRSHQAGRAKFLTSARIVIGSTLAVAVGIYIFDDGYLTPYASTFGQLMLGVVGAGFIGGYALLVKMGGAKPPPRYFKMTESDAAEPLGSQALS